MKYILLMLLAARASAAPLLQRQDIASIGVSTCGFIPTSSSFSGNSTFATVSGSTLSWTSRGGYPRIAIKAHFLAFDIRATVCLKATIDVSSGTVTACELAMESPSGGSNGFIVMLRNFTSTIGAGPHVVSLRYNTSHASGVQIPQAISSEEGVQLCLYDDQ